MGRYLAPGYLQVFWPPHLLRDSNQQPPNPQPSQVSGGSDPIVSFRHDSAEMDHSENEDITIKRADGTDKVLIRDRFWSLCRRGNPART